MNISTLLKVDKKEKCVYSLVDNLEVHIPKRYENYGLLSIAENVMTMGIFDIYHQDKLVGGLLLSATIQMEASDIVFKSIDTKDFVILKFKKGDKFIVRTDVVQNRKIAYFIFSEFISLGNLPKFLQYKDMMTLFDIIGKTCSVGFGANHVIFEMMWAHLFRDEDDLTKQYRHTKMDKPAKFINLQSVTYAPDSTSTRIIGPYFTDGVNSALANENTVRSNLEDFMRT